MIKNNLTKRITTSLILIIFLFFMYISSYAMIFGTLIVISIAFYEFNKLIFKINKKNYIKFTYSGIMLLYLLSFIFFVFFIEFVQSANPRYKLFIFYSIFVTISSDVGGFVIGKLFKGKKLTKVSPNKTISGSIGSFVFSLCIIPFFINYFSFIDLHLFISITFIISIISQLGDLFISFLKRLAKVKDTGNILPGHGGILDRVDGALFSVPMGLFLLDLISIIR